MAESFQPPVYRPAVTTEKCYLSEVLLWSAFGRFPEKLQLPGMDQDWRFSDESREDFAAPIPGGFYLTPAECRFAGIAQDPLGHAKVFGIDVLPPDEYPHILAAIEMMKGEKSIYYLAQQEAYALSQELYSRHADWMETFNHYADEFRTEILLFLQKGTLTAWGTRLPFVDRKKVWQHLVDEDIYLKDLEVQSIPKSMWVSNYVNWTESSLTSSTDSYCWIHFDTSEVLRFFPARRELRADGEGILPPGGAIPALPPLADIGVRIGRKPYPWDLFHVEMARRFRDNEIPQKKEAAIEEMRNWFNNKLGQDVSRSAVGEKLKPYYDQLVRSRQKVD